AHPRRPPRAAPTRPRQPRISTFCPERQPLGQAQSSRVVSEREHVPQRQPLGLPPTTKASSQSRAFAARASSITTRARPCYSSSSIVLTTSQSPSRRE